MNNYELQQDGVYVNGKKMETAANPMNVIISKEPCNNKKCKKLANNIKIKQ